MKIKVVKFGGSSLASGAGFLRVKRIIESDRDRRFVVVSAPGKRYKDDVKITDLLLSAREDMECFRVAAMRFEDIAIELSLQGGESGKKAATAAFEALEVLEESLKTKPENAYTVSRGEFLSAIMMAALLGREFIDAAEIIKFSNDGELEKDETKAKMIKRFKNVEAAVIPGFYGSDKNGRIHTFSRGGSDITGSLVAVGIKADIYENWTDVSGVYEKDPTVYKDARKYNFLTYEKMKNLSKAGANVLHSDAISPVEESNIPIIIKNSFKPYEKGTVISSEITEELI